MNIPKQNDPLKKSKDLAKSIRDDKRNSIINQKRGMKEKSVTRKLAKAGTKTPTEGTAFDTKPLMNKLSNLGFYSN